MAGPWEKYAQPSAQDGPWAKYGKTTAAATVAPETSIVDDIKQGIRNVVAGGVRGAGSIGATILYPWDKAQDLYYGDRDPGVSSLVTGKKPLSRNEERRQAMDEGLRSLGADTNSLAFKGGKLAVEIAGTAGTGGVLANGARAVGAAPSVVNALASGGMSGGGNMLTRIAGGSVTGGASAGLVDPETTLSGALIGGATPVVVKGAGLAGKAISDAAKKGANKLMQSAIKPTIAQLKSGDADAAIETLLQYGISPNKKGVEKLRDLIDQKNAEITNLISGSPATVDKRNVLNYLTDTRSTFANQVSPTGDLSAIDKVADDFVAHPLYPGNNLSVQAAQKLKQGTYKTLAKKYGQLGGAETEAQKALARGLKDEVASAVPGVSALNAEESRLLRTLNVTERRALMELNKNPMGLASLASDPVSWAAFMADRSAAFKALAARSVNKLANASDQSGNALQNLLANPVARTGAQISLSR